MRLVFVWLIRVVAALALVFAIAIAAVFVTSRQALSQRIATPRTAALDLSRGDPTRGAHLVKSMVGCEDCHGATLGGKVFINDAALGTIYAPNITGGRGGFLASHTDADFIQAVRYGVSPQGRPLLIMPSDSFISLSDEDLADILAYVRSRPKQNNTTPAPVLGIVGRVLIATGELPLPAIEVQHENLAPMRPVVAVSAAYGEYLARVSGCIACHGVGLSGGHLQGAPSDPPAQNLTPMGDLGHWTFAQFTSAIRTGTRPDGTHISTFMPWPDFSQMSDAELQAIWLYLKSVPPKPTGHG